MSCTVSYSFFFSNSTHCWTIKICSPVFTFVCLNGYYIYILQLDKFKLINLGVISSKMTSQFICKSLWSIIQPIKYDLLWILFKVNMNGQDSVRKRNRDRNESIDCAICGKTFTLRSNLSRHMRMHMGQFKFYCDKCKKGFADRSHFQEHMRKHEGLKYHCDYCGNPFANKHRYLYHLSVHTGKYRFSCERCSKGFNEQNLYSKHLKSCTI